MGLYENMARLEEAKLYNIVLVPSRLSASGRNKHHHHQQGVLAYGSHEAFVLVHKAWGGVVDKSIILT